MLCGISVKQKAAPNRKGVYAAGYTLVEIMIVVAIIGFLSATALMAVNRVRTISSYNTCLNNLNQINKAKVLWALVNKSNKSPTEDDLFGNDAFVRTKPKCPAGGDYDIGALDDDAKCTTPGHVLN